MMQFFLKSEQATSTLTANKTSLSASYRKRTGMFVVILSLCGFWHPSSPIASQGSFTQLVDVAAVSHQHSNTSNMKVTSLIQRAVQ
jgi:hypothetical protein